MTIFQRKQDHRPGQNIPGQNIEYKKIIICGGRRTGTTLLTAILSSADAANPLGQEAQILTRLVEAYKWGKDNFEYFGSSFFRDIESYCSYYEMAATELTNKMAGFASPGNILVLKNPELSKVIFEVTEILPSSTLFATVRDPRDQICSELEVGRRQIAAGIQNKMCQTRDIKMLSATYLRYISGILKLYKAEPERITIVKYEDLVSKPKQTQDFVSKVVGINLNFNHNRSWSNVSDKASLHSGFSKSELYGGPIKDSSIARYRNELTEAEIEVINRECEEFMTEFNYY